MVTKDEAKIYLKVLDQLQARKNTRERWFYLGVLASEDSIRNKKE